jgi:cytochrome c-type biogenesis protein
MVFGAITLLLGLVFLGALGRLPFLSREARVHRLVPARTGVAAAPALGFFFGLGWTPCLGPTIGAVLSLAALDDRASAARGSLLALVYCLGLGLPFVASGLALRRAVGAFDRVRRHQRGLMRVGGALLVVLGLLQLTGVYDRIVIEMQSLISGFETAV